MTAEDTTEKIGQLAELLDDAMFMAKMPLPDEMHKIGLLATMREVRDELVEMHAEATGGAEELNIQA